MSRPGLHQPAGGENSNYVIPAFRVQALMVLDGKPLAVTMARMVTLVEN